MNVVFICSEFSLNKDKASGGFGRYIETISGALSMKGHSVSIICRGSPKSQASHPKKPKIILIEPSGKKAIDAIRSLIKNSFINRLLNFLEYPILWSWAVHRMLVKLEKNMTLNIIEGGDFGAELFFYLLLSNNVVPIVIKLHTPSYLIREYNNEKLNLFYALMDFLEMYCLKQADFIYAPSKAIANQLSKRLKRSVKTIIPYPITSSMRTQQKRMKNVILYAGKLQPKKGIFILLQAAALLCQRWPKLQFFFVGPDTFWQGKSVKSQFANHVRRLRLSRFIRIRDEVSRKKLFTYYQKAVITVVPSFWENFPNVCLEAMVNGSLVIGSRAGGISEIIKHRSTGLLFTSGNPQSLAKALTVALTDENFQLDMVIKAERMIKERYDAARIANQTLLFYRSCMRNFSSSSEDA